MRSHIIFPALIIIILLSNLPQGAHGQSGNHAAESTLNKELLKMDSLFFQAILTSHSATELEKILAGDFIFFQDKGYNGSRFVQVRKEFISKIKEMWQPQTAGNEMTMRRAVDKESLQAILLNAQEAIQMGVQRFYLTAKNKPEQLVEESKFSRTWGYKNGTWQLKQELDYEIATELHNKPDTDTSRFHPDAYVPASAELYSTVVELDSMYFNTYNTCNLKKMRSMMADSIEFYHDKGGITTSLDLFIQSIQNNICGKVTRKSVPGSIEVYPIHNYGAVEIGYHRFFNNKEPDNGFSKPDKYIIIWQQKSTGWKITRVVSLH